MKTLTQFSTFLGLFIIFFFSVADFQKKLRKSKSLLRYYLAMSVFLSVNIAVYLLLTQVIYQESPLKLLIGNVTVNSGYFNALLPLVIALLYFGTGAGSFQFAGKEIQLHNKLLEVLQGVFNTRLIKAEDISYEISEVQSLYKKLRNKTENLQTSASSNQWNLLQDKWNDYADDEKILNKEVAYLSNLNEKQEAIKNRLGVDSTTYKEIIGVINDIKNHTNDITKILVRKLQKYLVEFAFANLRDENTLEKFLKDIEVLRDEEEKYSDSPNILARSLVMGFMFGLFFGPIFSIFAQKDAIIYSWMGALCLMIFTAFISLGVTEYNIIRSLTMGASGGYIANLLWIFVSEWEFSFVKLLNNLFKNGKWMEHGLGLAFGVVTSLLLFGFKYKLPQRIILSFKGYFLVALAGSISYPLVYILFHAKNIQIVAVLICSSIGVVAMLSMALAISIIKPIPALERDKMTKANEMIIKNSFD